MELLIGIIVIAFLFAPLVLPWVNRHRINKLKLEVRTLRAHINAILITLEKQGIDMTPQRFPELTPYMTSTPITVPQPAAASAEIPETQAAISPEIVLASAPEQTPAAKPAQKKSSAKKLGFEQQFGARLPVWIGGIALAFAGFYMIKYSIESGLLDERVRVTLGTVFGVALLAAGNWVRSRPHFANGTRIAQALSGAGIADLYVSSFAAANLYHLISPVTAFICMAVVTAAAVILSLRHGAPIALLGLLGGFLTPALIGSSEPNTPLLFAYLYAVLSGLMVVIRKERWWWLSIPTVLGAFGWVTLWLLSDYRPGDSVWVGLFLLGISVSVVAQSRRDVESGGMDKGGLLALPAILNYLTVSGACVLMGISAYHAGFTLLEWSFFGLLSIGAIALSWFNYRIYWFASWLALAVNIVMLRAWDAPSAGDYILVAASFAALFSLSGAWLLWRSERPVHWAAISVISAIGYYLQTYFHFSTGRRILAFLGEPAQDIHLWGYIAMALALASLAMTKAIFSRFHHEQAITQRLLATYALATTAFVSLSLCIEVPREFLSIAFALQILAVSAIGTRANIHALRWLAFGLLLCFGLIILPQLLMLSQVAIYSVSEIEWNVQNSIPMLKWPFFQLGFPALLFAGTSYFLRNRSDDWIVRLFEVSAIILLGIMGYYLARHAFHTPQEILFVKAGFTERGVITAVLFLFGLACLVFGRYFSRIAISKSGLVLCAIALFRTAYFDLFLYNPIMSEQDVGTMPILNSLVITYAAPAAFIAALNRELVALGYQQLIKFTGVFMLVLAFAFISFEVSQFYHGTQLGSGEVTNAEIYTYSVVWLLFGICLLLIGTLKKDKMIRVASLVVIILSVGKVFLYDADELTGLYRVFSFLGLGICLLGLSYFYTRFVFTGTKEGTQPHE